ncbi:uncharacterized protein LOC143264159 [Megachile rotundata]|uniref:uncharacterized protein LOC143264159 n=1 Tax=Megachile rotundata TaxID=143995 RepID=UPI003FD1055D
MALIKTISIPWLEFTCHDNCVNSSIVLTCIRKYASQQKPFIAHRISAVQTNVSVEHWRNINSTMNPVDFATRGIIRMNLRHSDLWQHGPSHRGFKALKNFGRPRFHSLLKKPRRFVLNTHDGDPATLDISESLNDHLHCGYCCRYPR